MEGSLEGPSTLARRLAPAQDDRTKESAAKAAGTQSRECLGEASLPLSECLGEATGPYEALGRPRLGL